MQLKKDKNPCQRIDDEPDDLFSADWPAAAWCAWLSALAFLLSIVCHSVSWGNIGFTTPTRVLVTLGFITVGLVIAVAPFLRNRRLFGTPYSRGRDQDYAGLRTRFSRTWPPIFWPLWIVAVCGAGIFTQGEVEMARESNYFPGDDLMALAVALMTSILICAAFGPKSWFIPHVPSHGAGTDHPES